MIFSIKRTKKLTLAHFSRFATLTGVIVTDRTCSTPYFLGYSFGRVGPLLLRFAKGAQTEKEREVEALLVTVTPVSVTIRLQ